jgi:hypothetical protein
MKRTTFGHRSNNLNAPPGNGGIGYVLRHISVLLVLPALSWSYPERGPLGVIRVRAPLTPPGKIDRNAFTGADLPSPMRKGWYVSLSLARDAMHVYTRNKAALRQSVMQPGERKPVWELVQALQRSKPQSRDRKMTDLWAARRAEMSRDVEMER